MNKERVVSGLGFLIMATLALILMMIMTACGSSPKVSNQDEQIRRLQRLLEQQITVSNQQAELLEQLLAADIGTQEDITEIYADLAAVQGNVNSLLVEVATLQGYKNIVAFIDPCGNHPTKIDEVLLSLSDGSTLVSFSDSSNGLNTRFSVLGAGNYVTSDGTNCHFSVLTNGSVTW